MRDQVRISIDRPVDAVFAILSDVEKTSRWYPNVIEEEWTSDGPVGVGSTRRSVSKSFGVRNENEAKVTVFDPNRMITMASTKSEVPFEISIGFEEVPSGTDVLWTIEMSPTGIYRPITRLSFPAFIRQLRAALENLKALMESGCPLRGSLTQSQQHSRPLRSTVAAQIAHRAAQYRAPTTAR